ncbi:RNase J family beta-CASP ribonuclease [Candidatus Uhrbacteria bacterium]|nr:RNase J family beta-CASP ribonuclease [Candidatus Uhrbacteria bacterium]MBD3284183.1 RNase J family beta-CASP ribonuclease [Candidatus Uhrbacteria bacterium]
MVEKKPQKRRAPARRKQSASANRAQQQPSNAPKETRAATPKRRPKKNSGNAPLSASLKEGFRKEEGSKRPKKKGSRFGLRGKFAQLPRMSAFKHKPFLKTGSDKDLLDPKGKRLRIMVLGGNEEVGRNCTLIEYGNDIIFIDMGLQFPDEDMPGVDYIIPNMSYIKGKEKNVRGVVITHAHYDHIGGVSHIVSKIGNPPVFATDLTCGILNKRHQDYRDKPPLNLHSVKYNDVIRLGAFTLEFFGVAHSVPSSMGVVINTPVGTIVHTGDFKLDEKPGAQSVQETEKIKSLGKRKVLALMSDSTNAEQPGRQLPEHEIQTNIDEIIANSQGKVIVGTFASMIARVQQIILACERAGRKIAIEGFSMKSNVAIAQELGYMKIQRGTLIDTKQIHNYPRDQVAIICTGAQGEERAALMRIAQREHPFINVEPGDTVVFSSSVIPGNERMVQRVKDTLYREGAEVIHYKMMDVHAGGHAKQEDLQQMLEWVRPNYLIPIEGHYSFLVEHAKASERIGFPREKIFIANNGQILEFDSKGNGQLTNKKVPTEYVFVDGLGVGDTNQIVLRDRQELAGDGIVIVVAVIDTRGGQLLNLPDIISRGFIYMKDNQDLIQQARRYSSKILKDNNPKSAANPTYLKEKLRDELGEFLFKQTERRPMILPVIVEV